MHRGSFPQGQKKDESNDVKRIRFEEWLIGTREQLVRSGDDQNHLDPEYDAVMSQPGYSANTSRPSVKKAIRANCWQCVSGNGEEGATQRIANCGHKDCPLWSVRPYQGGNKIARLKFTDIDKTGLNPRDYTAVALANPGNLRLALKGYCYDCCNGVMSEVRACPTVTCGLWRIRPGGKKTESNQNETEARAASEEHGD